MNIEHIQQFIHALRHGNYRKTKGFLARKHKVSDEEVRYEFCVWGVGMKLAGYHPEGDFGLARDDDPTKHTKMPSHRVKEWFGIGPTQDLVVNWPEGAEKLGDRAGRDYRWAAETKSLMCLNDNTTLTFPQIADLCDYFGVTVRGM